MSFHTNGDTRVWNEHQDFRAKATRGVALAALALFLPFTLYAFREGLYLIGLGGAHITVCLAINTWLIGRGLDHEPATLFCLVPGGTLFMGLAFTIDGNVASIWCFPSVLACYCMLGGIRARIANALILLVALPMAWHTLASIEAARFTASLLAVSVFASILVREIDAQQRRLKRQLDHDPLTGLLNRTSLMPRLHSAIEALDLALESSALLAIDLDHFKGINDRFGHQTGDRVLCETARLLREEIGAGGAVFRIGGEEFLVLLPGHDGILARRRAERLRVAIASGDILEDRAVTASIGVAALRMSDDASSWMQRADERLYQAKRAGRDRVMPAMPADADACVRMTVSS